MAPTEPLWTVPYMTECPQLATLDRYLRGELALAQEEALECHLTDCRSCVARMLGLGQKDSMPVVEHCHIVRELGRGRFGVVYKAWWSKDKPRLVALKWLTSAGYIERQRFSREIEVLKRINSPHIVKCLDSGTSGGTHYYIMSFVSGTHLDEYLTSSTSSLDEKLAIFQRICSAVAEAHEKGVVHRDLKPRNILVDGDGEPHILDFGICGLATEEWSSSVRGTITHIGDVLGTLKYMSPEQAWGGVSDPINKRSDIWALGIILYQIVTDGGYPYDLESTPDKLAHEALLERIRKEMPALPRLRSIERGRQLEILLERCLAWEADRRLNSAAQLATDIERYRRKERIKTRPFSLAHRCRRLAVGVATKSRWTALLALIAALQVMLWVTTFGFNVRWSATGNTYGGAGTVATLNSMDNARDSVVVVGTFDSTVSAVLDFAKCNQINGVTPDIKSWRAVHGHLMQRLVSAAPKAVVWDYYFQTPQPGDSELVGGVQMLEAAGIPVILAAQTYRDDGTPELSHDITGPLGDRMRHGAIVVRDMIEREGEFVLVTQRSGGAVLPGLPLTTLAAILHPEARLDVDWSGRAKHFDLLYETGTNLYLRERDRIELTKAFKQQRPQFTIRAGDLLGCVAFELRPPASWEVRTVRYEELLTGSPDRVRAMVMNKVLVIGDVRPRRLGFQADRHRVKYPGEIINDVPGCYLMADAIAGLMNKRYMKSAFPLAPTTFLLTLLFAGAGCLLPWRVAGIAALGTQRNRQALWVSLGVFSTFCFVLMAFVENWRAVHFGMWGISLLVPMSGSFWVEFTRTRHRILEERRRTVETLALEPDRSLRVGTNDRDRPKQKNDGTSHRWRHPAHPSDSPVFELS